MISLALAALLISLTGVEGTAGTDFISLEYEKRVPEQAKSVSPVTISKGSAADPVNYAWTSGCAFSYPSPSASSDCEIPGVCPNGESLWQLWIQRPEGWWEGTQQFSCFTDDEDPESPSAAAPVVIPAMILNEIRRIGLPDPELTTEPPGSTLVNLDTRFKTTDESFTAEVTLLGRSVTLRATPTQYVVDHGDGTSGSTSDASQAADDVLVHTHTYATSGTVSPQVTTTWSASFSVDGGPMTPIDETITITSPATTLDVRSSTPLLSSND